MLLDIFIEEVLRVPFSLRDLARCAVIKGLQSAVSIGLAKK
jgi:hypothetical protein